MASFNTVYGTNDRNVSAKNETQLPALLDLPTPTCAKELRRVSGLFSYYAKWIPNFSNKAGPHLHCNAFSLGQEAVLAFES